MPAESAAVEMFRQAEAALRAGRGDLALSALGQACTLDPAATAPRLLRGRLLAQAGRLPEALADFDAAARAGDEAEAWHLLGLTLGRLGRRREAIAPLRRARALAPGHLRTLELLAQAEFEAGDPAEALPLWRELHALRPGDEDTVLRLGETLSRVGRDDEARALFAGASQRMPGSPALCMALAQAEEIAGGREAARAAYERALALRPGWTRPLAGLLGLLRGKAPAARVDEARALLASPGLPDAERAILGYELGKVFDARDEPDAALAAWDAANAARRREAGEPDPAELERRIAASLAAYPAALLARAAELGDPDERPVFIVGLPRSGTTLLESILSAHARCAGAGELPDIAMIARDATGPEAEATRWPHLPGSIEPGAVRGAAQRYLAALTRHAPADALRIVDKYPMNYYALGLVRLMFPNARVLWCRRDPRDVAVSIYGENFAPAERLATSFAGIGHLARLHESLMAHWRGLPGGPLLEVHYEALVREPETQVRRVLEFCGLDWDPACLDFHRGARGVQTPSRWQVRQPLHTRSIGRWRRYAAAMPALVQALGRDPDAG